MAQSAAALVKVGEAGCYTDCMLEGLGGMHRGSLLLALHESPLFARELAAAPLSSCSVSVCASASATEPSRAEVRAGVLLAGALTLDAVFERLPTPAGGGRTYVYIDVRLPAAAAATTRGAAAAGALSDAGEWAPGRSCRRWVGRAGAAPGAGG